MQLSLGNSVPTMRYAANGAWQILSVLAFNLMRGFQVATTAEARTPNRTRRSFHIFERVESARYLWLNRAGIVTAPAGKATLDVGPTLAIRERFEAVEHRLRAAA